MSLHREGMGEDTSLNLSLFLIPVNTKISFLTNSEFMEIERVKLWMPHLISWRKPHSYIQRSDWCHLDGQALMTRCKVHLYFSANVSILLREILFFFLGIGCHGPWSTVFWNQLSLSQVTSTFHLILSAEHICLQFLEIIQGWEYMDHIYLFVVSLCYSFPPPGSSVLKLCYFWKKVCQVTLYI